MMEAQQLCRFFQDFGGRAVLLVRNPYAAILADHNFIYAGHHGSAPARNFERRGNAAHSRAHAELGLRSESTLKIDNVSDLPFLSVSFTTSILDCS